MPNNSDVFQLVDSADLTVGFRKPRGPYKTRQRITPLVEFDSGVFDLLSESEIDAEFEIVAEETFDELPEQYSHGKGAGKTRPIIFIDGEGSNEGEPSVAFRKGTLRRWVQKQNYSLLAASLQNGEYRCIIGQDNFRQLSSKQCLDFILSLPADHIIIGYSLTYDVEHWLRDLHGERNPNFPDKPSPMERLLKTQAVWWHGYRIHYIPNKIFTVGKYKGQKKVASRTVYDTFGFFQTAFKNAIANWNVGTPEERAFIEKMKDERDTFGPITEEVIAYNKMEGIHGIQMFSRVRKEYNNLDLSIPRPVGAGSIASAMYRKHGLDRFYPTQWLLPPETMLSAFYGGRFDVTRLGFVGDVIESDINSAYPHIARNLPCLRCGRYKVAKSYEPSPHSLWLVRWSDNGTRWSPFPYRSDNGHIRYFNNGIGWYYNDEVEAALRFTDNVEVIGGYAFQRNCEHKPFDWIQDYYDVRQEMVRNGDFGEKIIKGGLNSVYGKLAQSKGKNPRWQQLIWAGLITSGTRAMLLSAIAQNPDAVVKVATDAIFATEPLVLDYDETELGCWKTETLYDLLVLGNGVYHSPKSSNPKHPHGVAKNRGFEHGDKLLFDWEKIRENYRNGVVSIVEKKEFRRFVKAFHEHNLEERCYWIRMELELKVDVNKAKRVEGELIYPMANPTPTVISAPARMQNLNVPGSVLP